MPKRRKALNSPQVNVRLPRKWVRLLDQMAQGYGVEKNRSDLMREAIREYLQQKGFDLGRDEVGEQNET